MSTEIDTRPKTEIERTCQNRLIDVLHRYKKSIDAVLPKMIDPKRFAWLAVSAVRTNPALAGCTPASFINSVMLATQMGIEIRKDSAYLVPFGRECTLMVDYKAKMDLARRSGEVGGIQAVTIRERDEFSWHIDETGFHVTHRLHKGAQIVSPDERGPMTGFYAFAQLRQGGIQFREPMSLSEIDRIRKRSRAGVNFMSLPEIFEANELTQDGKQIIWQTWEYKDKRRQPWVTDFERMALKTVLHSLCKGLPLTPEAQLSQEVDEGYEMGQQPNILADAVDIDPVDEKPMIETGDKAHQQTIADQRIADLGGDGPDKRKPVAGTISDIKRYERALGKEGYFRVLGTNGYERPEQIPTEAEARRIKHLLNEEEAALANAAG